MWSILSLAVKFPNNNIKVLVLAIYRIYCIFISLLEIQRIVKNVYIS